MAAREQTSQESEIKFSIVNVIDSINRDNVIYSEVSDKFNYLKNDNFQSKVQRISGTDLGSSTGKKRDREQQKYIDESAKSQDFFQDNNATRKKIFEYSY